MKYTYRVFPPKFVPSRPVNPAEATVIFTPDNSDLSTVSVDIELPYFETKEEFLEAIESYVPRGQWASELYGDDIGDAIQDISGECI